MRGLLYIIYLTLCLFACSKPSEQPPAPAPVQLKAPTAVSLLKPENSSICLTGDVQSSYSSDVVFSWQPSADAETYDLEITNLTNNVMTIQNNLKGDKATVNLYRGVPYSWQVVAKSSKTKLTSASQSWNFYLSGSGITQYAPFPAKIIYPASGATVSAPLGKLNLQWEGSDPDSPNLSYEVYLDTLQTRVSKREVSPILTNNSKMTATVVSGKIYYWSIKTSDGQSSTPSSTFSFRVN